MGHITLATPVVHVWFSKGTPSKLSTLLDIPQKELESVVYFASYLVESIDEDKRKAAQKALEDLKNQRIDRVKEYVEQEKQNLESEEKAKLEEIQSGNKGLGEMNAEELWETTMDPQRRVLKQVTVEDSYEADKVFDILMGTDVPSRKSFIQSNAKTANLDI
jgi:DNA gyrase subunit B